MPESIDQEIAESRPQEMPESRDQEIAESRDQEIAESRDQEIAESRDQEMPESIDQEMPESIDQEIAESRDQEIAESRDQEMPESIDQHNIYLYKFNTLHSLSETSARHSFALCVFLVIIQSLWYRMLWRIGHLANLLLMLNCDSMYYYKYLLIGLKYVSCSLI